MADLKVTKEEHDKLQRAAEMYTRLTGESIGDIVGKIAVSDADADKEAEAKAADDRYRAQAAAQSAYEVAEQAHRRARAAVDAGGVQPGNPGPGMPAMATERAKAAGHDRHGEEPPTAKPSK